MNSILSAEMQCEDNKPCDVATTINDRLASKKRKLETELAETNAALEALQQNPEVARVLTLVGKAMGGRY